VNENSLLSIQRFGQSIWLDFIDREMIMSGKLKGLIEKDGIRGVTSNPKIFKDAISEGILKFIEPYDSLMTTLDQKRRKHAN